MSRPLFVVWCPECNEQLLRSGFEDVAASYADSHSLARHGEHHPVVREQR